MRVRAAISSTRAPAKPRSANSAVATSRISRWVRSASRWRSGTELSTTRASYARAVFMAVVRGRNGLVRTLAAGDRVHVSNEDSVVVGLIGSGIGGSFSPALHEREASLLGID